MRCPSRSGLLLLCGVLALLLGCTQEPPPLPPVPNAPEDLSTWSVPELVQPPAPLPEPVPEPVASKEKQPSAEHIFAYAPDKTFSLTVPVGAPLDIVFQRGEQVRNIIGSDRTPVEANQPPRWDIKEGGHGLGETLQQHIFLTAAYPGMTTGMVITTTFRTYYLTCKSVGKSPIRTVRWTYPHDPAAKPATPKEPGLLPDPAEQKFYHTGYILAASRPQAPEWSPRYIIDDGRKLYLILPEITLFQTAPMVRMIGPNGPQLVNSRQYLNVIIVDQLAPRLELRIGLDETAEVVSVTRGALRTIECPASPECPVWPQAAQHLARRQP